MCSEPGITVEAEPIYDPSRLDQNFSTDLVQLKILPVDIKVANERTSAVSYRVGDFTLEFSDGRSVPASSADALRSENKGRVLHGPYESLSCQAADKLAGGLGLSGLILIGFCLTTASPDVAEIERVLAKVERSALRDGSIGPHHVAHGFVFFPLDMKGLVEPRRIEVVLRRGAGAAIQCKVRIVIQGMVSEVTRKSTTTHHGRPMPPVLAAGADGT